MTGVLLYSFVHEALKGAPWVGSYSVVQCAAYVGTWRERVCGDGSTRYV